MRDAETILSIVRDRGRRRLPLDGVYRLLYNPALYLLAYGKIYRNTGAMTPGVTGETVDGMSQEKIGGIIELIRQERYRFAPARRVYIEKKNSTKKRPLGIPAWSDKLVQEVVRLILEAYYEPRFSKRSHGFRPDRGCHTALRDIQQTWRGTTWFIEGDIKGCFDNLDHEVLMNILREDIQDNRFLRVIEGLLKAGYLEEWTYHRTLSGSPQGGVVSPILANIYLDRLDKFVENTLVPEYTRGTKRRNNPEYHAMSSKYTRARKAGDRQTCRALRKRYTRIPCKDPYDPGYRRLRYIRYADDFLLGFAGPRAEAGDIKWQIGQFLGDNLKLEASEEKTLITHGRSEAARFLGYDIAVLGSDDKWSVRSDGRRTRSINGSIGLKVPTDVVKGKCVLYVAHGQPIHRIEQTNDDAYSIVTRYASEYRGIVEYYRLAFNLHRFERLRYVMESSLTKTLARKMKVSVSEVYRRYHAMIETERGPRAALQIVVPREGKKPLVATWGNTTLARMSNAALNDDPERIWNTRTEIVERLLADTCELCGSREDVEVHHIKALRNLSKPGQKEKPEWVKVMAARQRKTLVVCRACHMDIHNGRLPRKADKNTGYWKAG
jgi:group II intron reverse transcriptase/maturase